MGALQYDFTEKISTSDYANRITPSANPSKTTRFSFPSNDPLRNSSFNKNMSFNSVAGNVGSVSRYTPAGFLSYMGVEALSNYALKTYDDKFKELKMGKYAPPQNSSDPSSNTFNSSLPPSAIKTEILDLPSPVVSGKTLIGVLSDSSISTQSIANQFALSNQILHGGLSALDKSINSLIQLTSAQHEVEIAYKEAELNSNMNMIETLRSINASVELVRSDLTLIREITTAYNEQYLSNSDRLDSSIQNIASKVATVSTILQNGIHIEKTQDEIALTSKQLEHINYETTEIQLDNIGDTIPRATPQQMRAIKDAVVAKKNSDENTFEVDDTDIFDIFDGLPDISSIFDYDKKSDRLPTAGELL